MKGPNQRLDLGLRRIASFFYRIAMIGLGWIIIYRNGWMLPPLAYVTGCMGYFLAYILLMSSRRHILRLLIDTAWMLLVLWRASIDDYWVATFLSIPILNSMNFSGEKRSRLLGLMILCLCFYVTRSEPFIFYLVPLVIMFVLVEVSHLRAKFRSVQEEMHDTLDRFYESRITQQKPHEIFTHLMDRHQRSEFGHTMQIHNILCFKRYAKNYFLYNSAKFAMRSNLEEKDVVELQQSKRGLAFRNTWSTDNRLTRIEAAVYVKMEKSRGYIFVTEFTPKHKRWASIILFLHVRMYTYMVLAPMMKRVARHFDLEAEHGHYQRVRSGALKRDHDYMVKAMHSLHYVKGRLSPVKNYLDIAGDVQQEGRPPGVQRAALALLEDERRLAVNGLKEAMERTEEIMRADNPLNVSAVAPEALGDLIALLRSHMSEHCPDGTLAIDAHEQIVGSKRVHYNAYGMNIVLAELMYDMEKYAASQRAVHVALEPKRVYIKFRNDVNLSKVEVRDVHAHVEYLNSDTTDDVFKRKSMGGFIVKKFVRQMGGILTAGYDEELNVIDVKVEFKIEEQ